MDWASIFVIVVFFLWIVAGVSITKMREEERSPATGSRISDGAAVEMASQTREQTVEDTIVEEDGTIVKLTTKTVSNPDGSKSVTETREIVQQGGQRGVEPTIVVPVVTAQPSPYYKT